MFTTFVSCPPLSPTSIDTITYWRPNINFSPCRTSRHLISRTLSTIAWTLPHSVWWMWRVRRLWTSWSRWKSFSIVGKMLRMEARWLWRVKFDFHGNSLWIFNPQNLLIVLWKSSWESFSRTFRVENFQVLSKSFLDESFLKLLKKLKFYLKPNF